MSVSAKLLRPDSPAEPDGGEFGALLVRSAVAEHGDLDAGLGYGRESWLDIVELGPRPFVVCEVATKDRIEAVVIARRGANQG